MALWDDISNAVSTAADTVAEVVEQVVNGVAEAGADLVETAGNGAQDGLNFLGGLSDKIPVIGGGVKVVLQWLGGVIAGNENLVGAAIKGLINIAGGVLGGLIRIIGGLLALDGGLIVKGLIDIGSAIAGAVILFAGEILSFGQRIIPVQSPDRKLTKEEVARLEKVFWNSISLYNVRVIEGSAGLFGLSDDPTKRPRPFTLGNTIYLKDIDLETEFSVLVHECVHVWQYQNRGPRYTMDALGAQGIYGRSAYNWWEEFDRGTNEWINFNAEAQAEFMEDVWEDGRLTTSDGAIAIGDGAFYNLEEVLESDGAAFGEFKRGRTDFTAFATESIKVMRERINIRLSKLFQDL